MQSADNILTVSHGHYVHSGFKNKKQLTSQRRLKHVRSTLTRQRCRAKSTSSVTLHFAKAVHLNVALDGTKLAAKYIVFSCVSGGSHGQYSVSWSPIMETLCNLSLSLTWLRQCRSPSLPTKLDRFASFRRQILKEYCVVAINTLWLWDGLRAQPDLGNPPATPSPHP